MKRGWTLVTGASGFLGARLVRQLVDRGERVKAFVRAGSRLERLAGYDPRACELAYGDVTVEHTVFRALAGCDRAYHLAAHTEWWEADPRRIIDPAVEGTRAVLNAARRRGLQRVVVTSHLGVLGTTKKPKPMAEDDGRSPADPECFIVAKQQALELTMEAARGGDPVIVVIPAFMAGPGDWRPTPLGRILAGYLNGCFRLPLLDGGFCLADVDDVALGHIQAMQRGKPGQKYLLGGENIRYERFASILSEITGLPPPGPRRTPRSLSRLGSWLQIQSRLFGGAPWIPSRLARDTIGAYAYASSVKARLELGYEARPAAEALSRSVDWYVAHGYVRDQAARQVRIELGRAAR